MYIYVVCTLGERGKPSSKDSLQCGFWPIYVFLGKNGLSCA